MRSTHRATEDSWRMPSRLERPPDLRQRRPVPISQQEYPVASTSRQSGENLQTVSQPRSRIREQAGAGTSEGLPERVPGAGREDRARMKGNKPGATHASYMRGGVLQAEHPLVVSQAASGTEWVGVNILSRMRGPRMIRTASAASPVSGGAVASISATRDSTVMTGGVVADIMRGLPGEVRPERMQGPNLLCAAYDVAVEKRAHPEPR